MNPLATHPGTTALLALALLLGLSGLRILIVLAWHWWQDRRAEKRYQADRLTEREFRIFCQGVRARRGYGLPANIGGRKAS